MPDRPTAIPRDPISLVNGNTFKEEEENEKQEKEVDTTGRQLGSMCANIFVRTADD